MAFAHLRYAGSRRVDTRTWKQRRERELGAWDPIIDRMTDAYIQWKYGCSPEASDSESGEPRYPYHVTVMDIFTMAEDVTVHRPATSTAPAVDIALHGYLCKTPGKPKIAVGFQTLELFHRVRLRKASLSVEAFTRVICDYYEACHCPRYIGILLTSVLRSPSAGTSVQFLQRLTKSTYGS